MNCKQFAKVMGDYVNRTLSEDVAENAEIHLSLCAKCASMVKELEHTSDFVRSLERASTPAGFEERLKTRLAAHRASESSVTSGTGVWGGLRAIGTRLKELPAHGHRLGLRPALVGLLLCAIIAGSIFMLAQGQHSETAEMDWGYIETCQDQHALFAGSNPLADESAVMLRERARDLGEGL